MGIQNFDYPFGTLPNTTVLVVGTSSESVLEFKDGAPLPYIFHQINHADEALGWLNQPSNAHLLAHTAIVLNAKWADDNRMRFVRQLTGHDIFRAIPVIVISERFHWAAPSTYLEAGADDYFSQPIPVERLSAVLQCLWASKAEALAFETESQKQVVYRAKGTKRLMDIAGASFGLALLSPLMLATMVAIKLESKGPIFYKSSRVGAGFITFDFWKFRSMYADADQRLEELKKLNQYGSDATFIKFSNDPRVTRVGRFIRKYSIDELPQLFNILRGDMSLVGNRPLPVYEADALANNGQYSERFFAPAGLTGVWQVSKRGTDDMSMDERIQLDIDYARNHGLKRDAKILLRTFTAFVQKENV